MPKCPKCQYFSFDSGDRCRNCGYDFSLWIDTTPDDLPIQTGSEPLGPFDGLTLIDDTPTLPRCDPGGDPDAPLVSPGAAPRAPLAVRRGAPTTGRPARPRPRPEADASPRLALDTAEFPIVPAPARAPAVAAAIPEPAESPADSQAAGSVARLGAAAIDLALLGGID